MLKIVARHCRGTCDSKFLIRKFRTVLTLFLHLSTAFAPDFQALPRNVEYLECEDEFDIVENGKGVSDSKEEDNVEDDAVDILTIEHVPVFQSDSEDEEEVFMFQTSINRQTASGKGAAGADTAN